MMDPAESKHVIKVLGIENTSPSPGGGDVISSLLCRDADRILNSVDPFGVKDLN